MNILRPSKSFQLVSFPKLSPEIDELNFCISIYTNNIKEREGNRNETSILQERENQEGSYIHDKDLSFCHQTYGAMIKWDYDPTNAA